MGERTETPTGIETGKHTSTEESGGELDNPAIVLKGDGASETETVKGPADVPVVDLVGLGEKVKLWHGKWSHVRYQERSQSRLCSRRWQRTNRSEPKPSYEQPRRRHDRGAAA